MSSHLGEQYHNQAWLHDGLISYQIVPKYIFFVDTFPKTASGKVQKFVLRGMAEELVAKGKGSQ